MPIPMNSEQTGIQFSTPLAAPENARQRALTDYVRFAATDWHYLPEEAGIAHLRHRHLYHADFWIRMVIYATEMPGDREVYTQPLVTDGSAIKL